MTPVTIYMVAMNDGTDEIFNLAQFTLTVNPDELIVKQAWQRMLKAEYEVWKGDDAFLYYNDEREEGEPELTDEQCFQRWMSERFYFPSLVDLSLVLEHQNAKTEKLIDASAFRSIEDAFTLANAMVRGLRSVAE